MSDVKPITKEEREVSANWDADEFEMSGHWLRDAYEARVKELEALLSVALTDFESNFGQVIDMETHWTVRARAALGETE